MKKLLLIFFILLSFLSEAQLLSFKNFTHKNGLNQLSVLSLAQDKHGFIWIGLDGAGLQRYDGKIFQTIKDGDNSEHHVSSIEPSDEGIYFSSKYYGFFLYQKQKIKKVTEIIGFGEHLEIKKLNKTLCLVGQRKIVLKYGNKTVQEFNIDYKDWNHNLIQCLEINQNSDKALLLLGTVSSYYVTENKIIKLDTWLNLDKSFSPSCVKYTTNKLELYDLKNQEKLTLSLSDKNTIISLKRENFQLSFPTQIKRAYGKNGKLILTDTANNLYNLDKSLRYIPKNYSFQDFSSENLFIDKNYDYWICTSNNGLFKLSKEPFTKIEINSSFKNPLISYIYKTQDKKFILSDYKGNTFINSNSWHKYTKIELRIFGQTNFQGKDVFATNKGILVYENGKFVPFKTLKISSKVIFIYSTNQHLFYCEEGHGLTLFNSETKKISNVIHKNQVSHIYTAQMNKFNTKIIFGTNIGLFEYKFSTKEIKNINQRFDYDLLGAYSGVSTVDSYGNLWFAVDKVLLGITPSEEYIKITDKKHFVSTLFYNLNSDKYGNLILGTNLGITKLKIDYLGNVINSFHYSNINGFEGYETHMRSNFKLNNNIYIGTIEGLFKINTESLEKLPIPPAPLVFQQKEKSNFKLNSDEELIKINFLAINPKLNGIQYAYRLKGKTLIWSDLTNKNEAYFSNLSDQDYTFQVKSTYDGLHFSTISNYKIIKETPFWKSKWFILFLVLSITLANIVVLDRSKSFELGQIIDNQAFEISGKIKSILLAFGFVSISCSHFFAVYVENNLPNFVWLNAIISTILFLLFLTSIVKNKFKKIKKYSLQIALFSILIHSYLGAFLSSIHPIYVIVISLLTAITPFVLYRIKDVILFSVFQLISVVSIMFLLENTIYNEVLFLIAVLVSISMSIFITYIRNETLQKLIFISGIINKGNMLAIGFNQDNKITYVSENSDSILDITPNLCLGKSLIELNKHVFLDLTEEIINFETLFQDEEKHIIPMIRPNGSEIWIEWSCKVFSKSIKIIFGQDISERVRIANNYDSLIENAEDLIYTVDVNGKFLFTNIKFQKQLAYTEEELIGRNSLFLVGSNQEAQIKAFYENQFQKRLLNTYTEFPIRKKDGSEIWVGQRTTILYAVGSSTIVKGFLSIARDITERREQQKLIEDQKATIDSNFNYAKKIQSNLLPTEEKFKHCFSESEIFFQAKDTVSGDFYWLEEISGTVFFVLADCTGHGVPGSFMTVLASNLLNQLILKDNNLNPGEILSKMDESLIRILSKEANSKVKDRIELTLIAFEKDKKKLSYACAGGKFATLENGEIVIQRGESKHLGDLAEANFSQYNTYNLDPKMISNFYFFTDGIQDQLGEQMNGKFTLKRILEELTKNREESLEMNVQKIKTKVNLWKNKIEQTDDMTFIGLKL
ncbi:MAG: PAS domain S-box protein [Bacteroidota bacterium]